MKSKRYVTDTYRSMLCNFGLKVCVKVAMCGGAGNGAVDYISLIAQLCSLYLPR